jgi:hypothetical protein
MHMRSFVLDPLQLAAAILLSLAPPLAAQFQPYRPPPPTLYSQDRQVSIEWKDTRAATYDTNIARRINPHGATRPPQMARRPRHPQPSHAASDALSSAHQ